jgi:hypothetical protein
MPNRYILALIRSETFNVAPHDADQFAGRERRPHTDQRAQPAQQTGDSSDQLSFAFVS